jgi:hypothetical protein
MILPSKHIRNCESLIGLGSILINKLDQPKTIDELWSDFEQINNTKDCPTLHSFDNVILALDLLFVLGKIQFNEKQIIRNETN